MTTVPRVATRAASQPAPTRTSTRLGERNANPTVQFADERLQPKKTMKRKAVKTKTAPKAKKKKAIAPADSDTDSVESVTPPQRKPTGILRNSPASQSSVGTTNTLPTRPTGHPKEPQRQYIDPANEMDWVLYDTPMALHVWVAKGNLKRVKFGQHIKFKIDTASSLDSLEELYQLLQDACDLEGWDITADQEGFKLYYRDQLFRGIQTAGEPLRSMADYLTSQSARAPVTELEGQAGVTNVWGSIPHQYASSTPNAITTCQINSRIVL
jgi:hypothetical protein